VGVVIGTVIGAVIGVGGTAGLPAAALPAAPLAGAGAPAAPEVGAPVLLPSHTIAVFMPGTSVTSGAVLDSTRSMH
jgi:hypothetical protein